MQFHSFTTSVAPNILIAVPIKKEKLPLSITHPELAKQANGWDPQGVSAGSGVSRPWICELGHVWNTSCANRTTYKSNCPVCAGQKAWAGFNDLATTHPELAKEAHGWDPTKVIAGSNRKLEWICSKGHIWAAVGYSRISGNGCPFCGNKKVLPGFNDLRTIFPEIALEADGWDPSLVIPGSGNKVSWRCSQGHQWIARVADRTGPEKNGCPYCSNKKVIPGFNDLASAFPEIAKEAHGWDPSHQLAGSNAMREWCCSLGHTWSASVIQRSRIATGCPYCLNHKILKGFNDLATTHPSLAVEANGWDTTMFPAGSNKKMSWSCKFSHNWDASINSRVSGTGCPFCSGKYVLVGFNDLATTHPSLAAEASGWDPKKYSKGNTEKLEWVCREGHTWKTTVSHRVEGTGCPTCSISGFDPNAEAWLYFLTHPYWNMSQIGITNFPDDRLKSHKKLGWVVLELRGPMDGHLAQQWETAILRMLKAKEADLSNEKIAGKFDGYSEAWSKSTFEVKSIKELMMLTEEFEADGKTR